MTMIVHGFPSKTAALQFEWAWQHPNLSRNLKDADGNGVVGRSRGLAGHIKAVRLMINSHPYSTWPLHVKLFTTEAVHAWNNAAKTYPSLPRGFKSSIELEGVDGKKESIHVGSGRTGPIDIHDTIFIKQHLETASKLRAIQSKVSCTVCSSQIDFKAADPLTVALCPTSSCHAVSHISCLADNFLAHEHSKGLIPRGGYCSSCNEWTLWGDIIKGADRRKYGPSTGEDSDEMSEDDPESEAAAGLVDNITISSTPKTQIGKVSPRKAKVPREKVVLTEKTRAKRGPLGPTSKPRRDRRAKPATAGASTSAGRYAGAGTDTEDFTHLIKAIDEATEDEHSSDHIAGVLSGVSLASPKHPR